MVDGDLHPHLWMPHDDYALPVGQPAIGYLALLCLRQPIRNLDDSSGWWNISWLCHCHRNTVDRWHMLCERRLGTVSSPLSLIKILSYGDIAANQVCTLSCCFTRKLLSCMYFI